MAYEQTLLDVPIEAHEDLSADQFRFVMMDATTKRVRRPDSGIEIAVGVLQNAPAAAGRGAHVCTHGLTKVRAGEALAVGDEVKPEYVSATDAGKAIKATGVLETVHGLVIEPATAEDQLATILLYTPQKGSKRKLISVELSAFTANATVYVPILAINKAIKVTGIWAAAITIPVDADGTSTLLVYNHDKSASADDALMAAAYNMEGLVSKETTAMGLTATAADLVLEAGDFLFAALTNNSAAIDTNMADALVTIEYEDLA